MIGLQLTELADVLGCATPDRQVQVDNIVTDSRKVRHGTLFAALAGSQVDGHDYAASAVQLGAAALLVSRRLDLDIPQLVVVDVLQALGRLATMLRNQVDPVVIAVTGSNGKTTVKEMIASILACRGDVLATRGNYNNELGVPLSLFEIEQRHRFAVLEMGASKAGDITYLCEIVRPDVGLITNIGPAHLRGFGSEGGVVGSGGLPNAPTNVRVFFAPRVSESHLSPPSTPVENPTSWGPAAVEPHDTLRARETLLCIVVA